MWVSFGLFRDSFEIAWGYIESLKGLYAVPLKRLDRNCALFYVIYIYIHSFLYGLRGPGLPGASGAGRPGEL